MTGGLIRSHLARFVAAVLAAVAGVMAATALASSGATPQTVTLGDTSGTPNTNLCPVATTGQSPGCTFVPFSSVGSPELQVPFDGTVTAFSVFAGSAGGTVTLRVLRPAAGGQYTAVASSAPETLALNGNTFTTSLPVQTGDLIGLDNASSALIFDDTSTVPLTAYFEPGLADGQTGAPNQIAGGTRLLLSATVQAGATQTTTTPTTFTNTTPNHPPPTRRAPRISGVHQSHASWHEPSTRGGQSGRVAGVGTTFSFRLNEAAQVHLRFDALLPGRRVGRRCVARTDPNHARRACIRALLRGRLNTRGHPGSNRVAFRGRLPGSMTLSPGRYALLITATAAGRRSGVSRLVFRVLAPR